MANKKSCFKQLWEIFITFVKDENSGLRLPFANKYSKNNIHTLIERQLKDKNDKTVD